MRIKAAAMGLDAEDYFSDRTLDDTEMLYSGRMELPEDFWETHGKKCRVGRKMDKLGTKFLDH